MEYIFGYVNLIFSNQIEKLVGERSFIN